MTIYIWVNIGSGYGLLANNTKPLPETMLTYHQRGSVAFTWVSAHELKSVTYEKGFNRSHIVLIGKK